MSTLTDAINPILADLAVARADWIEFNGELNAVVSMMVSAEQQLADVDSKITAEVSGNNSPERLRDFSVDRLAIQNTLGAMSVQRGAMASIVEMAEVYYVGIENLLKSKIIQIQGDNAIFSTYVPVRPGVMSEAQPTPARQLVRNEVAMEAYRRLYKENGYRLNKPLPTV